MENLSIWQYIKRITKMFGITSGIERLVYIHNFGKEFLYDAPCEDRKVFLFTNKCSKYWRKKTIHELNTLETSCKGYGFCLYIFYEDGTYCVSNPSLADWHFNEKSFIESDYSTVTHVRPLTNREMFCFIADNYLGYNPENSFANTQKKRISFRKGRKYNK